VTPASGENVDSRLATGGATAPVCESISWTLGSRQCAGAWLGSSEFIAG
jgi:hypothetical protein